MFLENTSVEIHRDSDVSKTRAQFNLVTKLIEFMLKHTQRKFNKKLEEHQTRLPWEDVLMAFSTSSV